MQPGIYKAVVTRAYRSTAAKKGTPCVAVEVVFAEGERMMGNIWLPTRTSKPTAAPFARRQLEAIGFDVDRSALDDITLAGCVGTECDATLALETYNGKQTLKISSFSNNPQPTEDDIEAALTMMRAAKDDSPATRPASAPATAQAETMPPDDYVPPATDPQIPF